MRGSQIVIFRYSIMQLISNSGPMVKHYRMFCGIKATSNVGHFKSSPVPHYHSLTSLSMQPMYVPTCIYTFHRPTCTDKHGHRIMQPKRLHMFELLYFVGQCEMQFLCIDWICEYLYISNDFQDT